MIPGEIICASGSIEINKDAPRLTLEVANSGDRPIQVGSHYHFYETNIALKFDRDEGARLAARHSRRHRGALRAGPAPRGDLGADRRRAPRLRLPAEDHGTALMPQPLSRAAYAAMYGPTVGDRVRLADTELFIEVEKDFTVPWRGGEIRRRQGDPRRHGPVAGHPRRRCHGHGHHQRPDPRPLGHRQSRYRPEGRPHRRHRQGGQPRHPARRHHHHRPGRRRSSPARAASSPPAASTAISISSPRSRSRRRSIPASPPCWAAAPARPMAPWPPPARRGRGIFSA